MIINSTVLRYYGRVIAYKTAITRRLIKRISLQPRTPEENAIYWDEMLSGTDWKTYLGNTFEIDCGNSVISTIIKHYATTNPTVLDIACGGGTLSLAIPNFKEYMGVDVSQYATDLASKNINK